MRDLINMGKMVGPRMFVSGTGIRITRSLGPPVPVGIMVDGVDAVMRAARQVIASGADWVKVYGSTGGFDDLTQFQTFTFEEMKAAVDVAHALGRKVAIHSYGPAGARMPFAPALIRSSMRRTWTTRRLRKWSSGRSSTSRRSITTSTVENADNVHRFPAGTKERLLDYIRRNLETARKAFTPARGWSPARMPSTTAGA
jgi:hypothetical protein